ncbi:hypothetical protein DID88_006741 [Monilinia fructigena]|uniref:Ketoreductase (KR) domain-containing protein n=1 Tax=Monilinia fructigena TaxID=38457 RepID=A0A395IFG2_9HELO|nr:hypothetical protein DID88_006741 [Monilinia fructigena]
MADKSDPNFYTTPYAITKNIRRDPYWAIDSKNPANKQSGKIIIITGASSGIGAAAAKVWTEAHASGIVLAARRVAAIDSLIEKLQPISPGTKFLRVKVDIVNEDDVKNLFQVVQEQFGRPADVLLNNAGLLQDGFIGETEPSTWWKGIETNLKGLYQMTHHYIQSQPSPSQPIGTIISVSSGRAGFTSPRGSAYNISKLAEERNRTYRYGFSRLQTIRSGSRRFNWYVGALSGTRESGLFERWMVAVNWDVEELEEYKEEIVEGNLLKTSWLPILPLNGGKKLSGVRSQA